MSSVELTHWIAFSRLEPFGQAIDDYRAGVGAVTYMNMRRKEGTAPLSPLALFPWQERAVEEASRVTPEEESAAIINLFAQVAPDV